MNGLDCHVTAEYDINTLALPSRSLYKNQGWYFFHNKGHIEGLKLRIQVFKEGSHKIPEVVMDGNAGQHVDDLYIDFFIVLYSVSSFRFTMFLISTSFQTCITASILLIFYWTSAVGTVLPCFLVAHYQWRLPNSTVTNATTTKQTEALMFQKANFGGCGQVRCHEIVILMFSCKPYRVKTNYQI